MGIIANAKQYLEKKATSVALRAADGVAKAAILNPRQIQQDIHGDPLGSLSLGRLRHPGDVPGHGPHPGRENGRGPGGLPPCQPVLPLSG